MLIGDVGIRFTATVKKSDPPVVVLSFSEPVNPTISTDAGTLRMTFRRQPVVSYSERFTFENNLIPSATYTESGGTAELTMTGTAPLMASFSDGGKTITISPAPGGEVAAASATAPASAAPAGVENPATPTTTAPAPTTAVAVSPGTPTPVRPKYLVVIDASHGGDERGAALTEDLAEKDVNLAMAYRLRSELQNRGITCFMVREGDSTVGLDQRAAIANESRAAVFISLHADMVGTGVRVYTSLLPASDPQPSPFLPWDAAQRPFQASSRLLADTVLGELDKQQIPAAMLPAPLRPLNNVAATAIAVELAPQKPDIHSLTAKYEQAVAAAVANAIATARPKLEAAR
jgi:N-acetylmuramoyl-L-alanine amidase